MPRGAARSATRAAAGAGAAPTPTTTAEMPRAKATAWVAAATETLRRRGDVRLAAAQEAYHKGAYGTRGLRARQVDDFAVEAWRGGLKAWDAADVLAAARLLFEERHLEAKELGARVWAFAGEPGRTREAIARLRSDVFERGLAPGWAACDSLCSRVLRPAVKASPDVAADVAAWGALATSPWTVRASCVTFVCEAKRDDRLRAHGVTAARAALASPFVGERFVQLGVGWLLRDVGRGDQRLADAFLAQHLAVMSPEGLRYAIEARPTAEAASWVAKRREVPSSQAKAPAPPSQPSQRDETAREGPAKRARRS